MKRLLLLLIVMTLAGCSKTTPTQAIADNAVVAMQELKKELPEVCKTKEVYAKIDRVDALINTLPKTCELQVQNMRLERNSYALGFFSMVGLLLLVLVRKLAR